MGQTLSAIDLALGSATLHSRKSRPAQRRFSNGPHLSRVKSFHCVARAPPGWKDPGVFLVGQPTSARVPQFPCSLVPLFPIPYSLFPRKLYSGTSMPDSAVLLIDCPDRRGLVARVSWPALSSTAPTSSMPTSIRTMSRTSSSCASSFHSLSHKAPPRICRTQCRSTSRNSALPSHPSLSSWA